MHLNSDLRFFDTATRVHLPFAWDDQENSMFHRFRKDAVVTARVGRTGRYDFDGLNGSALLSAFLCLIIHWSSEPTADGRYYFSSAGYFAAISSR